MSHCSALVQRAVLSFLQNCVYGGRLGLALLGLLCAPACAALPSLPHEGVELGLAYKGEVFGTAADGERRGDVYLDRLDLTADADLEKLAGWPAARVFLRGIAVHGGSPSSRAGDVQTLSNIDAPDATRLYEAFFEQALDEDRISLLGGLYDLNSEFDVMPAAGLFLNSSHGIGKDFSQTGRNGPSIFPTTSLAARLRRRLGAAGYLQAAVLDAVSGDVDHPRGTHVRLHADDGALLVSELGWQAPDDEPVRLPKLAVGGWFYTARFAPLDPGRRVSLPRAANFGVYALTELAPYREPGSAEQGLSLFARVGIANPRFNSVGVYAGAGAVYTGLFPGRPADRLGLAVATAFRGRSDRSVLRAAGERSAPEIALELTYRIDCNRWLSLQPDVQYLIHPGMTPGRASWAWGLRLEVDLQ